MAKKELKFYIATGTVGRLRKDGKDIFLNMDGEMVDVPILFWKLVIEQKTLAHVVFLIFMDNKATPAEKTAFQTNYKCACKCNQLNFEFSGETKRGFTRCCTIDDLKDIVGYINGVITDMELDPNSIKSTNLFSKPEKSGAPQRKPSVSKPESSAAGTARGRKAPDATSKQPPARKPSTRGKTRPRG